MATVLNQAMSAIMRNYADVIEGGNSYRGSGTVYRGIPGTYPYDDGVRNGDDTPLTVADGDFNSTTTFEATAGSWATSRWVPESGPGFWAFCNTAGDNYQQARKVTGYQDSSTVFTVAPAFSGSPSAADSMVMLQGFKRIPNTVDIEAEEVGVDGGYDRHFHLFALPGVDEDRSGRGVRSKRTELNLRLRLLKHSRVHDVVASAFENLAILTAAIESSHSPDHRDGTYTTALWAEEAAEEVVNDNIKVVVLQKFVLIYQFNAELL